MGKLRSDYKSLRNLSRQQKWRRNKKMAKMVKSKNKTQLCSNVPFSIIDGDELAPVMSSTESSSFVEVSADSLNVSPDGTKENVSPDGTEESFSTTSFIMPIHATTTEDFTSSSFPLTTVSAIKTWVLGESNVPRSAVTRLLKLLQPLHPSLPATIDGLLERPHLTYEVMCDTGCYVYFKNWLRALKQLLSCISETSYSLLVNVDGLPLFKSSPNYKLYPILVLVRGLSSRPICAGIYCTMDNTNREMPNSSLLLKDFLKDLQQLQNHPIVIRGMSFTLQSFSFVCDAPARASLKMIKGHAGYHSCERCEVAGEYHGGHVCLLNTSAVLRTESSFLLQTDKQHHSGISALVGTGMGMVSDFILDYMHLTCLGVMRRLLLWWRGVRK